MLRTPLTQEFGEAEAKAEAGGQSDSTPPAKMVRQIQLVAATGLLDSAHTAYKAMIETFCVFNLHGIPAPWQNWSDNVLNPELRKDLMVSNAFYYAILLVALFAMRHYMRSRDGHHGKWGKRAGALLVLLTSLLNFGIVIISAYILAHELPSSGSVNDAAQANWNDVLVYILAAVCYLVFGVGWLFLLAFRLYAHTNARRTSFHGSLRTLSGLLHLKHDPKTDDIARWDTSSSMWGQMYADYHFKARYFEVWVGLERLLIGTALGVLQEESQLYVFVIIQLITSAVIARVEPYLSPYLNLESNILAVLNLAAGIVIMVALYLQTVDTALLIAVGAIEALTIVVLVYRTVGDIVKKVLLAVFCLPCRLKEALSSTKAEVDGAGAQAGGGSGSLGMFEMAGVFLPSSSHTSDDGNKTETQEVRPDH